MTAQPPPLPDLSKIVSSIPGTGSSTSGSSTSDYGLSKDAAGYQFNLQGLPGLGSGGTAKGSDVLNAFLAAGSSGDPQAAAIVAAIQQSLMYAGYYSSSYTPNFGVAKKQDAEALATALSDLYHANQGRPNQQTISQWLTGQASVGVTSGGLASQSLSSQLAPTVVNLRAPNSADVAAVYEKVAQQTLGHKPSAEETAAFVQNYTQSYLANEKANINAQYDATVQKAQVKIQQGQARTQIVKPASTTPDPNVGANMNPNVANGGTEPTGAGSGNLNPNVIYGGTPPGQPQQDQASLIDSMSTLQDVVGQRLQEANGSASASTTAPAIITAGTTASESPEVAAENFARNTNPHAAAATDLNSTFQDFLSILNGKIG